MSGRWYPPIAGSRVLHADGEEREVVATFIHEGETRIVTAHRFGGPESRWVYETFGRSAAETGLLRFVSRPPVRWPHEFPVDD